VNIKTDVIFDTSYELLKKLTDTAERRCLDNLRYFDDRLVLIEGGGYEKIWLETQPMSGEMYAKRNLVAGLNNQLLFMENQRSDGRLPGSIACVDGKIVPQFDKFQGFCFPAHAFNMYFLSGKDKAYLELLYTVLERFDAYLWNVRDSDGDGCLEAWCKYDTGEDHAERYGDAPDSWDKEYPPADRAMVPIASMDIMSFSYSCRDTLSRISQILGNESDKGKWEGLALEVKQKIREFLWDGKKGACYDRDKHHNQMPVLIHNNLRTMYWKSLYPDMAERFVREHLLNPDEFWTTMPLPSVAVNDPLFRNIPTNNWSGQCEALTYQRAIQALSNYGYDYLIPILGEKLFTAIGDECAFVQQFDPFTGKPSILDISTSYGPALVSVMEYVARMYGVSIEGEEIHWGTVGGYESSYEQIWGEHSFKIINHKTSVKGYIDGKTVFESGADLKVVTDLTGKVLKVIPYVPDAKFHDIKTYIN